MVIELPDGLDHDWEDWYEPACGTDVADAVAPLVRQLRDYDALRRRIEAEGGAVAEVVRITELLSASFTLEAHRRPRDVSLIDQRALHDALWDLSGGSVHLDVRQLDTRMPIYYLCRIRRDYWADYSLIVEDLYRSPGHVLVDERFVKLMRSGHETYFLRLSPFRDSLAAPAPADPAAARRDVDDRLHALGRHVFQAAWHDDQRVAFLAAAHFGLRHFRHAVELLYLCLSGDLCELRSALRTDMLSFFETVYPQPAIHAFLTRLAAIAHGASLSEIPQQALKLYARLSKAFGRFLDVRVPWGARQAALPLYKLVFGNIPRLAILAKALQANPHLAQAAGQLDAEAQRITEAAIAF